MKIIALGDFHGKFPSKLKKRILRENPDLIVSVGDLPDTSALRNLEFKYWDEIVKGEKFSDLIGKLRYTFLLRKTLSSSKKILRELKSFNVPIVSIYGNSDTLNKEACKYGLGGFERQCLDFDVRLLRHGSMKFGDLDILGFSGYRGAIQKGLVRDVEEKIIKKAKRYDVKWKKEMGRIFGKMTNPSQSIFVAHDVPLGCFDKILLKSNPLYGKHLGEVYALNYIKRYQPAVYVCGHMHEYQGVKRIGRTKVVAVGPAYEGKAAIIETGEDSRIKLKFIG